MWDKLEKTICGIAVWNFRGDGISEALTLTFGDRVHISATSQDWYRGYVNKERTKLGIFPKSHVHLLVFPNQDSLHTRCQATSLDSPNLEEVVVVLKDWSEILRDLFKNPFFSSVQLCTMRGVFIKLSNLRRDILSGQLTMEEIKEAKVKISQIMTDGNSKLSKWCSKLSDLSRRWETPKKILALVPTVDGDIIEGGKDCNLVELFEIHKQCAEDLIQTPWNAKRIPDIYGTISKNKKFGDMNLDTGTLTKGRKQSVIDLTIDQATPTKSRKSSVVDLFFQSEGNNLLSVPSPAMSVSDRLQRSSSPQRGSHPNRLSRKSFETGTSTYIYNILFHLHSFGCGVQDDAEVFFALYDASDKEGKGRFISERYLCRFNKHGFPNNHSDIDNQKAVFTDLGMEDVTRELYITCHIVRKGADAIKKYPVHRKPYGCGVISIVDLLSNINIETSAENKATFQMKIYSTTPNNEADFWQLHENIIKRPQNFNRTAPENIGIHFTLQTMVGQVEHLALNKKVVIARKLGFSDIIMPGDVRNDLYIILQSASFDKDRKQNVQVTLRAIDPIGRELPHICPGDGDADMNEYNSFVIHTSNPNWNETVKLNIPMDVFRDPNTHIRFEFRHIGSEKKGKNGKRLFGMAFMRLMKDDGTAVEDGVHDLFFYKCQEQHEFADPTSYLDLPYCEKDLGNKSSRASGNGTFTRSMKELFSVRTVVCSTKLTQNVDLLGLLQWKSNKKPQLEETLRKIRNVDGRDIVRVLQDILDALFSILDDNSSTYGNGVFWCLVTILNILNQPHFKSFTTVLDKYIETHFVSTNAHNILCEYLTFYLRRVEDHLIPVKEMLFGLRYFFKFIFMSHRLLQQTSGECEERDIVEKTRDLCAEMNVLMSKRSPDLEDHQLIILQSSKEICAEMCNQQVYTMDEVCQFTVELLESIKSKGLHKNIRLAKFKCISETIASPIFGNSGARRVFLKPVLLQLNQHIAWEEDASSCVQVVSEILSALHRIANKENGSLSDIDQDVKFIVQYLFESLLNLINKQDRKSDIMEGTTTCLLALCSLMRKPHYQQIRAPLATDVASLHAFLCKIFTVFTHITARDIFSGTEWVVMKMSSSWVLIEAIKSLSEDLPVLVMPGPDTLELWRKFFKLAVQFITQPTLQLEEKYTQARRWQLQEFYGDRRLEMATLIQEKWIALGEFQTHFDSFEIVQSFLEVSLIPQHEIRTTILPLIFDIVHWSWKKNNNLYDIEEVLIDTIDDIVGGKRKGDENYAHIFKEVLSEKIEFCVWKEDGKQLVCKVFMLLERLIDFRLSQMQKENRYLRLSAIHSLMDFYKNEVVRERIYTRNIYTLKDIHLEVNDYLEASCTLMILADTLNWVYTRLPADGRFPRQKQWERKETLYNEILTLVDKGKAWEFGIPLMKELAVQYETNLFDYQKLSAVLKKQASFYDNILKPGQRDDPTYFKVCFYGSFPHIRRHQEFIFRGKPFDKLDSISERLQSDFPRAKSWSKASPPTADDLADGQQYIEVRLVNAVPPDHPIFVGKDVPSEIIGYYNSHDIKQFRYDRPFYRGKKDKADPANEIKTLWVERTVFTTAQKLPGLLGWSEIVDSNSYEIRPIENAVEAMEKKSNSILELNRVYRTTHDNVNINPFTMQLQGTIDAAVGGGIKMYQLAFLGSEYKKNNPEDEGYITRLQDLIRRQLDLLSDGLAIHGNLCNDQMKPLQENLEERLKGLRKDFKMESGSSTLHRTSSSLSVGPSGRTVKTFTRTLPLSANQRSTSIFFVPPPEHNALSPTAKHSPSLSERKSVSTSKLTSQTAIEEEPADTMADGQSDSRDSGIIVSDAPQGPPVPPRKPSRPDSSGSMSSLGSSNFSSSGASSRPSSSDGELGDNEKKLEPSPLATTDHSDSGANEGNPDPKHSPPPLPTKKKSMRIDASSGPPVQASNGVSPTTPQQPQQIKADAPPPIPDRPNRKSRIDMPTSPYTKFIPQNIPSSPSSPTNRTNPSQPSSPAAVPPQTAVTPQSTVPPQARARTSLAERVPYQNQSIHSTNGPPVLPKKSKARPAP